MDLKWWKLAYLAPNETCWRTAFFVIVIVTTAML